MVFEEFIVREAVEDVFEIFQFQANQKNITLQYLETPEPIIESQSSI
jgi:hypothetical protein